MAARLVRATLAALSSEAAPLAINVSPIGTKKARQPAKINQKAISSLAVGDPPGLARATPPVAMTKMALPIKPRCKLLLSIVSASIEFCETFRVDYTSSSPKVSKEEGIAFIRSYSV
jgi:hypothetical protein